MKHLFLLLFGLSILSVTSCNDDDDIQPQGTLTVNFKAVYDGAPLVTYTDYPFANGQQLQFSLVSLMIADMELSNSSGSEVIEDIALADMSYHMLADAEKGYSITNLKVKTGTYTGMKFSIGVPPDDNTNVPADYPSSSPLSQTSYYWIPWSSYIFSKTEGLLDSLGTGTFDLGFALHTGSDALYLTLEGTPSITIAAGEETIIDILVDYKKILEGIDIKGNPQNHNPNDIAAITAIVNNYATSITLVQ